MHAGAQVNIDYESEQDMVEKMRIGLALQPLATALFANSPFRNGQDSGALPSSLWYFLQCIICFQARWLVPCAVASTPFAWCRREFQDSVSSIFALQTHKP